MVAHGQMKKVRTIARTRWGSRVLMRLFLVDGYAPCNVNSSTLSEL